MKKKNIKFLIIAIITLFVCVAGIAYAYFSVNVKSNDMYSVTTNTSKRDMFIANGMSTLVTDVTNDKMQNKASATAYISTIEKSGTFTVSLTAGSGVATCDYDLAISNSGTDGYMKSANLNGLFEYTVQGSENGILKQKFSEINVDDAMNSDLAPTTAGESDEQVYSGILGNYTIFDSYDEGKETQEATIQTWTIITNFYNLNKPQDEQEKKIYSYDVKVVNVNCANGTSNINSSEETEETDESSGLLTRGTIDRNTGSFNDNKIPECYTQSITNLYDFTNIIEVVANDDYEILGEDDEALGYIAVPANSTKQFTYCIRPTGDVNNDTFTLPIKYKSYNTNDKLVDRINFTTTTKRVTLVMETNFYDGKIICNNVTTGEDGIINTTGKGSAAAMIGQTVECSVGDQNALASNSDYEYYDENNAVADYFYEQWEITSDTSTYQRKINLTSKTYTFAYGDSTNHTGTYTMLHDGYYLIELWGAKGGDGAGNYARDGGSGGYVYGYINFTENSSIYFVFGGAGYDGKNNNRSGGFNGGGSLNNDPSYKGGTGGGYSVIMQNNSDGNMIAIAGGGGGGGGSGGAFGGSRGEYGGAGGNLSSDKSTVTANSSLKVLAGTAFNGYDGSTLQTSTFSGKGGTGSAGGAAGYHGSLSADAGSFLLGGNSNNRAGAGGGGLYGGGGGLAKNKANTGENPGGGGGGSSYLANLFTYSNLSNAVTSRLGSNPGGNNGGLRITYIGSTV